MVGNKLALVGSIVVIVDVPWLIGKAGEDKVRVVGAEVLLVASIVVIVVMTSSIDEGEEDKVGVVGAGVALGSDGDENVADTIFVESVAASESRGLEVTDGCIVLVDDGISKVGVGEIPGVEDPKAVLVVSTTTSVTIEVIRLDT